MNKIVISLTTISSRIDSVNLVIESLLSQELEGDYTFDIELYISQEPFMIDKGIAHIPENLNRLREDNRFTINVVPNIGSYRKFYYVLNEYFVGDRSFEYLVTADDDTIYPAGWLQTLVDTCNENSCCVAFRGRRMVYENNLLKPYKRWRWNDDLLKEKSLLNVGTGKDGIIYKPSFFHKGVVDLLGCLEHIGHADDLWLKAHVAMNLVPTVILEPNLSKSLTDVPGTKEISLYTTINEKGGNDYSMIALKKFLLLRYRIDIDDFFNENYSGNSTIQQVFTL